EKSRSLISSCRRGGVVQKFLNHTTPSAPLKVASLLSLDVAASPPPAEEGSRLLQLSKRSGNLDSNAWPGGAIDRLRLSERTSNSGHYPRARRYGFNAACVLLHVSGQPSRQASAYKAAGSLSRSSPLLPRKMMGQSSSIGGAVVKFTELPGRAVK